MYPNVKFPSDICFTKKPGHSKWHRQTSVLIMIVKNANYITGRVWLPNVHVSVVSGSGSMDHESEPKVMDMI